MKRALIVLAVVGVFAAGGFSFAQDEAEVKKGPPIEEFHVRHRKAPMPRLRAETKINPDGTTIRHGAVVSWYESGKVYYKGEWRNGKKHGTWTT